MPANQKRLLLLKIPQKLQINYKLTDDDISFTRARFDNGPYLNASEHEIVTSTGPYIIRFKFDQVKEDYLSEPRRQHRAIPKIYIQEDSIVDKTFSYNSDSLFVALKHDLLIL